MKRRNFFVSLAGLACSAVGLKWPAGGEPPRQFVSRADALANAELLRAKVAARLEAFAEKSPPEWRERLDLLLKEMQEWQWEF